jgi:hypothetical protein
MVIKDQRLAVGRHRSRSQDDRRSGIAGVAAGTADGRRADRQRATVDQAHEPLTAASPVLSAGEVRRLNEESSDAT